MLNFKVSELINYIKEITNKDFILNQLCVEGEVSNLTKHSGGNAYFSIKDDFSRLACIIYNYKSVENINSLENGNQVMLKGKITLVESEGTIKLIATEVNNIGLGNIFERFEKTKKELEEQGYFSAEHKKPLPQFAKRIGIISSSDGAAIKDIISVTKRRNPYVSLVLYPAAVQGINSAKTLIDGLDFFMDYDDVDLVIIGRGGGSYEDLDSFNSKELAIKIFNFNKPIISAVGHEIDFVISDFVADMRAPTPSAAAELAVFDHYETIKEIENKISIIFKNLENKFEKELSRLKTLDSRLKLISVDKIVDNKLSENTKLIKNLKKSLLTNIIFKSNNLDLYYKKINKEKVLNLLGENENKLINLKNRSFKNIDYKYMAMERKLLVLKSRLEKLDIKSMQKQGYSMVLNEDLNLIKNVESVDIDELLSVLMENGELKVKVVDKKVY